MNCYAISIFQKNNNNWMLIANKSMCKCFERKKTAAKIKYDCLFYFCANQKPVYLICTRKADQHVNSINICRLNHQNFTRMRERCIDWFTFTTISVHRHMPCEYTRDMHKSANDPIALCLHRTYSSLFTMPILLLCLVSKYRVAVRYVRMTTPRVCSHCAL